MQKKKGWLWLVAIAVVGIIIYSAAGSGGGGGGSSGGSGGGSGIKLYPCPNASCKYGYTTCFICAGTGEGFNINPYNGSVSRCAGCNGDKWVQCQWCKGKTFLYQSEYDALNAQVAQQFPGYRPSAGLAPKGKTQCGNCQTY